EHPGCSKRVSRLFARRGVAAQRRDELLVHLGNAHPGGRPTVRGGERADHLAGNAPGVAPRAKQLPLRWGIRGDAVSRLSDVPANPVLWVDRPLADSAWCSRWPPLSWVFSPRRRLRPRPITSSE